MADPFYTCCEDGMLSQVPPTDNSGLCPACHPGGNLRRLTNEELAEQLRVPGTLTWGQCRNMAEQLRAQGVVAYGAGEPSDTADEDAYVIDKLARLLAEIAVILKGPELPIHSHSYHDLPALVAELKQRAAGVMGTLNTEEKS